MKKIFLLFISASFFLFSGCRKEKPINLDFEASRSITPDQEWAVVVVPYAAFLEKCDYSANVKSHARRGDIFLVTGKEFVKKENQDNTTRRGKKNADEFECWYKFDQGCLSSSLVDIYDAKLKAENAASKLNEGK